MRKRHSELIWITSTLTSLDICAQTMFGMLTIQIIILNKKIKQWSTMKFSSRLSFTIDQPAHEIGWFLLHRRVTMGSDEHACMPNLARALVSRIKKYASYNRL